MYLVTGATGTVGREIVKQLLAAGRPVRALTRNEKAEFPPGVEVVIGDLTKPETLDEAFEEVTGLHLITATDGAPLATGPEIVERAGNVERISVLSSFYRGGVEAALDARGLPWTLLVPVEFMANTREWADQIRTEHKLRWYRKAPSAMVHEADIAAVAVLALTEDGHAGQEYLITGPEALTPEERVRIIGDVLDTTIGFERLTEEQERARLVDAGWDVEFGLLLAHNPPEVGMRPTPTVQNLTGRPARTFQQWVTENAAMFRD